MSKRADMHSGMDTEAGDQQKQLRDIIGLGEFSIRKSYYPELRQKIKELRESESRFRDFADSAADWFWEMDQELRFSHVTGRNEEIMGIKPESIIGLTRQEVYKGSQDLTSPKWQQHLRTLNEHKPFTDFEIRWLRPDGGERFLALSGKPRFDATGRFLGYRGVGRDISERRRIEEALRSAHKSDAMFKNLVENISGAAYRCLLDTNWTIEYISQGIEEITGFRSDVFIGNSVRSYSSIIHPDDAERVDREVRMAVSANKPYLLEYRIIHADGGTRWVWERGRACDEESEQGVHLEGVLADITEHKQTEQALRRAQKMDAVGQLTGGIAHDFNNILAIIIGNLDLLEHDISGDERSLHRVETIRKSAQRAADLTRKLLGFARQQAGIVTVTDINQIIDGMRSLIARSVTPEIEVELRLAEALWSTRIDQGDFEDALLNLVINAHDAMPGGGHLTLQTSNCLLDSDYCSHNPGTSPGAFVQLKVSDDGEGIAAELHESIFEPFFTTKAQGKGTGLGLAMVFGFVKRSGGSIKVDSAVGKGSSFEIYLPRAEQMENRQPAAVSPAGNAYRGSETILLVDDETDLLELAGEWLQSLGYRVLTASDGQQALRLLEEESSIDLLCSDVVMPGGINGYELVEKALAKRSGLQVLLVSGYTEQGMIGSHPARSAVTLLSKPYTQTELAHQIRTLLDGAKG